MKNQQFTLEVDLQSFKTCHFCLRTIPILLIEALFFFVFAKELIKTKRIYDRTDKLVFFLSLFLIGVDLISLSIFQLAISSFSHGVRLFWTLALYFIFLRFVYQNRESSQIFITTFLLLILSLIVEIIYKRKVYIRYPLLVLYIIIIFCSLHQILFIRSILSKEIARKKSMNRFLRESRKTSKEIQLIEQNQIIQYKVLSQKFKYHIKLRRSFCFAIIVGLMVNYFFIADLSSSRQSIGQFFVVIVGELLLPAIYLCYTMVNQWIIQKTEALKKDQNDDKEHLIEGQL